MSLDRFNNRLFVVNKSRGPSSFDVVEAFRKVSRIRKVGHTGTLDPLAEGVLLLCSGKATRAVEHFMNLHKVYEFDVFLGSETDTLDSEGEIVREVPCPDLSSEEISAAAAAFVGEYRLQPPAFSALKHKGKRLYELARAGQRAQVERRVVTILDMEVLEIALPRVRLRTRCTRGTYVRSLAKDFGETLGVPAHIRHLVRTAVGPFEIGDAYPSQRIFASDVDDLTGICISEALGFLPGIVLRDSSKEAFMAGALPTGRDVVKTVGTFDSGCAVRILDESGELLAIGSRSSEDERKKFSLVDSFRLFVDRSH